MVSFALPVRLRRQQRIRGGIPRLRASASRAGCRTVVCPLEFSETCHRGTIHNWASRNRRPFRAIRWLEPVSREARAPQRLYATYGAYAGAVWSWRAERRARNAPLWSVRPAEPTRAPRTSEATGHPAAHFAPLEFSPR